MAKKKKLKWKKNWHKLINPLIFFPNIEHDTNSMFYLFMAGQDRFGSGPLIRGHTILTRGMWHMAHPLWTLASVTWTKRGEFKKQNYERDWMQTNFICLWIFLTMPFTAFSSTQIQQHSFYCEPLAFIVAFTETVEVLPLTLPFYLFSRYLDKLLIYDNTTDTNRCGNKPSRLQFTQCGENRRLTRREKMASKLLVSVQI